MPSTPHMVTAASAPGMPHHSGQHYHDGRGDDSVASSHFARATWAGLAQEYTLSEAAMVKQAFAPHNFSSLKSLPSTITANALSEARDAQIAENLKRTTKDKIAIPAAFKSLRRSGLFQTFEYVPSPYALADELKRDREREVRGDGACCCCCCCCCQTSNTTSAALLLLPRRPPSNS